MYCEKCKTEVADEGVYCKRCRVKFYKKIGIYIAAVAILLVIGYCTKYVYNILQVKNGVTAYVNKTLIKQTTYYKTHSLVGIYANELNMEFKDDFDNLSREQKYAHLYNLLINFNRVNGDLAYDYSISSDYARIINVHTSRNTYKVTNFGDYVENNETFWKHDFEKTSTTESNNSSSEYSIPKESSDDEKGILWGCAKDAVRQSLKTPSTAEFPFSYASAEIQDLGNGNYVVKSYVDAQNGFGAMIRSNFTVTIKKVGDGVFQAEDVSISE